MMKTENMISILKKIMIVLALAAVALLSVNKLAPYSADPATHAHSIEQLDKEIDSVLKLSAGATGVSAAISLLPGDACTPISTQFADLVKYFLIVLSALYLEKYLVTLVGTVSFAFIIPLACAILACGLVFGKERLKVLSVKVALSAFALYLVIPVSVITSEAVYSSYESSLESTLDSANEITIEDDDASVVERFTSWIENAAVTVVDYVTDLLSRFVEAIAVMLVTSCLIPILVVLLFVWVEKLIFRNDVYPLVADGIKINESGKTVRTLIEKKD